MTIATLGIDLARNVFALHGVDAAGKPVLARPNVTRRQLMELVAGLSPCLIGMEACSGAHHRARAFSAHGHTLRLMAPEFVAPYRLSGKRGENDAADAQAIYEAVGRPHMRFVPTKTPIVDVQPDSHPRRNTFELVDPEHMSNESHHPITRRLTNVS